MNEGEQRRNILIIGGLVGVLILSILAVYFSFFYEPTEEEAEPPSFGEESEGREQTNTEEETFDRTNREAWDDAPPRLVRLTEEPVSGATSFVNEDGESVVRYAERQTSHIYDIPYDTFDDERISNETIPGVHEALFANNGDSVIFRYLGDDNQTIRTYSARLEERDQSEEETPYALEGEFLQNNIRQISVSPTTDRIFWLTDSLREARGFVSDPDGSNQEEVFASDFTEWIPQWFGSNSITMTTKASGHVPGHIYGLDLQTGSLDKFGGVSEITGLTTLMSPSGEYILYAEHTEDGSPRTYIYNTETGERTSLFMRTLPEKCAWTPDSETIYCGVPRSLPDGTYPDIWYKGRVLFADEIWEIDVNTGDTREILSPSEEHNEDLDIYRPFVSEGGAHLIFTNKRDMSLWSFRLEEAQVVPEQIPEGAPGI